MNGTHQPATIPARISDEEIQTALIVLDELKIELKAHTKRRMDRIPNNEAWDVKATHVDYELRGNLSRIHCLKLELKRWIKRRAKKAGTAATI
jgi:hypothetical protein